jgi:hypothetical protein
MRGPDVLRGIAAALALAGCTAEPLPESAEVATRDITIAIDAHDSGDGAARVEIRILAIIGQVRLTGGDTLRVRAAGVELPLREEETSEGVVYVAEPGSLTGDLSLDLQRPADRSVRDMAVHVPPPFTLTAQGPMGNAPLSLEWDAAPGADHLLQLSISGACIRPLGRNLASDVGFYRIDPSELAHATPDAPATCPLEVTLSRSVTTQKPLFPPLPGGFLWVTAQQLREVGASWQP